MGKLASQVRLFALFLVIAWLFLDACSMRAGVSHEAEPLVRALEARYSSARTLQALFLERYADARSTIQVESGIVYFSKPGRMRWEYEVPEKKLFVADGKTVWFFVPSDRTVTRSPVKESSDWRTPLALLTGKAKLSELCSEVDLAQPSKASPEDRVLRCLPRGEKTAAHAGPENDTADENITAPNAPFNQVFLDVDPETGELTDVRVLQPGGIEIEYRFGNWQENVPLDESLFRFVAPPGVAILDDSNAGRRGR